MIAQAKAPDDVGLIRSDCSTPKFLEGSIPDLLTSMTNVRTTRSTLMTDLSNITVSRVKGSHPLGGFEEVESSRTTLNLSVRTAVEADLQEITIPGDFSLSTIPDH